VGARGRERSTGLRTRHYNGQEKPAGLKTHTYNNEETNYRKRRNRMTGRAIGWIARRTWGMVARDWRGGKIFYRE